MKQRVDRQPCTQMLDTQAQGADSHVIARRIREHIDDHFSRRAWLTRHANACLMARERFYAEHQADTGANLAPWHRFVRSDGTSATRDGTRWIAISDVLVNYAVNRLVDHTRLWRAWIDVVDDQCASFNQELGDLSIQWVGRWAFETPYVEYARHYARARVAASLMDEDDLVTSDWRGTPIAEDEITAVLVAAQLARPTCTS
jgi:hypothetical protein